MEREEIRKLLNNTKVYVNGKSKEIQEKLFSFEYGWWVIDSTKVNHVEKPFLFIHKEGYISYGNDMCRFIENKYREISAEEILSLEVYENNKFAETYNQLVKLFDAVDKQPKDIAVILSKSQEEIKRDNAIANKKVKQQISSFMKNYVLHYEETEVCIANLDVSVLNKDDSKKSTLDPEKQKVALQLIKGWISDVTEGNITVKSISVTDLKEGIKQENYSIRLVDGHNLRVVKTNHSISIKEVENEKI